MQAQPQPIVLPPDAADLGAARWVETDHGRALDFDGKRARVDCGRDVIPALDDALTLCAWVYPRRIPQGEMLIAGESPHYYGLTFYKNGKAYFYAAGGGGLSASALLPVGQWSHLAGVFDGQSARLYIDGKQVASRQAKPDQGAITSKLPLRIGGDGAKESFDGMICGVRLYPAVLLHDEILVLADEFNQQRAAKLREAVDHLFDDIPTARYSKATLKLMRSFQMGNWAASSSGNLGEYATPQLADRRAAELAAGGCNAVLISGRQNRFNYPHIADQIAQRQRLVADACHRHGIRVFDHLDFTIYWQSSFPVFFEHPQWAQRDLRDGTPSKWMCLNQPDYREFYARYLEKLVRTGLDGFMLDEISFHDQRKTYCGCDHCRRKFHEQTGFRFPEHYADDVIGNRDDPMFQLWRKWQRRSIVEFKAFLLERIRRINPDAVIVAYCTAIYRPSVRASDMQEHARVCFVGTEGTNTVWPGYANFYSQHRILSAFTRRFGRPSWAHFAANTGKEFVFSAYHAAMTGSGTWAHHQHVSDVYNWAHWPEARAWGEPVGDIAVILPSPSRDGNLGQSELHISEAAGWCQAFGVDGVQFAIVPGLYVRAEDLRRFKAVVLPHAPYLHARLGDAVDAFVNAGGTAIVTGTAGRFDRLGNPWGDSAFFRRMSMRAIHESDNPQLIRWVMHGARDRAITLAHELNLRVDLPRCFRYDPVFQDDAPHQVLARFAEDDTPAVVSIPRGKGRYIYVGFLPGQIVYQPRMYKSTVWSDYLNPDVVSLMTSLASQATGGTDPVGVEGRGVLSATYTDGRRVWVRLLNVSGVNIQPGERVGTPTPAFPPLEAIRIRVNLLVKDEVTLFTPDRDQPLVLQRDADQVLIPAGVFDQFAFVRMELP